MPATRFPELTQEDRVWTDYDPDTNTFLDRGTGKRVRPDGTPVAEGATLPPITHAPGRGPVPIEDIDRAIGGRGTGAIPSAVPDYPPLRQRPPISGEFLGLPEISRAPEHPTVEPFTPLRGRPMDIATPRSFLTSEAEEERYPGIDIIPPATSAAKVIKTIAGLPAKYQAFVEPFGGVFAAGRSEQGTRRLRQIWESKNPKTPNEYLKAIRDAAGEYERERPEEFKGEKFLTEALADPANLIGIGLEPRIARAVVGLAKRGGRLAGEAIETARPIARELAVSETGALTPGQRASIGDRVRLVDDPAKEGVVIGNRTEGENAQWIVKLDDGPTVNVDEDALVKAEIARGQGEMIPPEIRPPKVQAAIEQAAQDSFDGILMTDINGDFRLRYKGKLPRLAPYNRVLQDASVTDEEIHQAYRQLVEAPKLEVVEPSPAPPDIRPPTPASAFGGEPGITTPLTREEIRQASDLGLGIQRGKEAEIRAAIAGGGGRGAGGGGTGRGGRPVPGGTGAPLEGDNVLGLRPITAGIGRTEKLKNVFRTIVRRPKTDELVTPAMAERKRIQITVDSQAVQIGQEARYRLSQAFNTDDVGRIVDLPGNPTIQDVAARLPLYEAHLTPAQREALQWLRAKLAPYRQLWDEVQQDAGVLAERKAKELNTRGDVMDGGFYVPRGRAGLEGADEPVKVGTGRGTGQAASGYSKAASFDSMAQALDNGYEYGAVHDALQSYVQSIGTDINNRYISNYLLELADSNGVRIAQTAADRVDPQLRTAVQKLAASIGGKRITAIRQEVRSRMAGQSAKVAQRLADRAEQLAANAEKRMMQRVTAESTDAVISQAEKDIRRLRREASKRVAHAHVAERTEQARQATGRARLSAWQAAERQATYQNTISELDTLQSQLYDLRGRYKRAQDIAKSVPRDRGGIGLVELTGYDFPDALANAANMVLNSEKPISGRLSGVIKTANALNNLYKGFTSTLDNSSIGIQGLLGIATDQKAYGKALKVNAQAWMNEGENITGKFYQAFDEQATSKGLPTIQEWTKYDLHIGGGAHEFTLGTGGLEGVVKKTKNVPLVGGTIRLGKDAVDRANRAFGAFGDALRPGWAQDMLESELRKGATLDQLRASGTLDEIAASANRMTGWSPDKFANDLGDLVLYAPRFLQSRLETVALGVRGLVPIGTTYEQRAARNALLKLIGFGTMLTVGVNAAQGRDTDLRPIIQNSKGEWIRNSNFMRARWNNRDWSFFGSWDSLAGAIIETGLGHPERVVRNMGSGITKLGWDIISGTDALGKPIRRNALEFAAYIADTFAPFSAEGVISGAVGTVQEAAQGDIGGTIAGVGTTFGAFVGGKSAELSYTDIKRDVAIEKGYDPNNLDRSQEREINDDPRVQAKVAEFPPPMPTDNETLDMAFRQIDVKNTSLEIGLREKIDAGMQGKALREAIQGFKTAKYEAGDTIFGEPLTKAALERATAGKRKQVQDVLAQRYLDVPLRIDPRTGDADYKTYNAQREQVLQEFDRLGLDRKYAAERGPGTYRGERAKDLVVRATLDGYDRDQETLRPYWEVGNKWLERIPAAKELVEAGKANPLMESYLGQFKAVKDYRAFVKEEKDMMLRSQPDVLKALRKWYPDLLSREALIASEATR